MKPGKPLVRTAFKPANEPKSTKGPRSKKCANRACRGPYVPDATRPYVKWCSPDCGAVVALAMIAKRRAAKEKAERADIKRRKQAIKTIPQLKADLQEVFNLCMRLEDEKAGRGCICCGKFPTALALSQPGGAWDCCHFRSRGSADHLRYNEDNAWRGLKDCNTWGHKDYRGGLIALIGIQRVEALESNNTTIKWDRDWLISQKAHYAVRVLQLKKDAA
jgi:hypothetical protein